MSGQLKKEKKLSLSSTIDLEAITEVRLLTMQEIDKKKVKQMKIWRVPFGKRNSNGTNDLRSNSC
jgi:hypothetical protein